MVGASCGGVMDIEWWLGRWTEQNVQAKRDGRVPNAGYWLLITKCVFDTTVEIQFATAANYRE